MRSLKKLFWTGILVFLILWILIVFFKFLSNTLTPLRQTLFLFTKKSIPGTEFLLFFAFILFLGLLVQLFSRLSRKKFFPLKRLTLFIQMIQRASNRLEAGEIKAVLTQITENLFLIGFSTGEIIKLNNEEYYAVLLPSTPNPTTGYCFLIPKDKVNFLPKELVRPMLKIILSGGIFQ